MLTVHERSERLRALPTVVVRAVLAELGIRRTLVSGLRPVVGTGTLAGPVRTLRYLPAREDVPGSPVARRAVETLQEGEILVVDALECTGAAVFGDMMAARAQRLGAAGVVADGAVRDVPGMRGVGLPVWARGLHPDPSSVALVPWEADVAVRCGGCLVQPGDWILADDEAVLVIPAALLDELLARAPGQAAAEDFSQRLLAAGWALDEAYPLPQDMRTHLSRFLRDGTVPVPHRTDES
ncbi:RraA family protein [Amycolatopsis viridis]|uniref:Putative 4-hydroxy-4-methyl-2-oxoglutarate aldolase n=1 Tax=Amycolatopsis viridis TaxID=185678 RepID=A0ABX0SNB0_9PSEU|nr:hypothetical protein [Amycolatopsis viridis]NIH78461.1 regulator of RNase E activity RraA [Amycolatopsis viridis]